MKSTKSEIKNILEGSNSRVDEAEERISKLEYKAVEPIHSEQFKGKRIKRVKIT